MSLNMDIWRLVFWTLYYGHNQIHESRSSEINCPATGNSAAIQLHEERTSIMKR